MLVSVLGRRPASSHRYDLPGSPTASVGHRLWSFDKIDYIHAEYCMNLTSHHLSWQGGGSTRSYAAAFRLRPVMVQSVPCYANISCCRLLSRYASSGPASRRLDPQASHERPRPLVALWARRMANGALMITSHFLDFRFLGFGTIGRRDFDILAMLLACHCHGSSNSQWTSGRAVALRSCA